jgi:hypothetical protein
MRRARHRLELCWPWLLIAAILLLALVVGRLPGG